MNVFLFVVCLSVVVVFFIFYLAAYSLELATGAVKCLPVLLLAGWHTCGAKQY